MKKILIIGGSYGIGNTLAKSLCDDHQVVCISRTSMFEHGNVEHYQLDALKEDLPDMDALHGLVYCPGSINLKPFKRLSIEDFTQDFEINVLGAVRVLQHYMPALKAGQGSAVLFSTVATKMGMPFHASVSASKSAVEGLVKSLAAEYAPTVRFNAIAPTVTDTPLASKLLRNDKQRELMQERHPLKQYLNPEDVASYVAFLLSDKAKAISGQVLPVDAGLVSLKL